MKRSATADRSLSKMREEVRRCLGAPPLGDASERRRHRRVVVEQPGTLRVGDLTLPGVIESVAQGGAFFCTGVLLETGERGILAREGGPAVPVLTIWCRPATHPRGPGLGLAWAGGGDAQAERATLELILALVPAPIE